MKFFQLTLIAIFSFAISTNAQKATAKAIIKTPGITCEACKDRVERVLFKMYGVATVKADFKKKTTTVTWVTDRTDIEEIKTAIANAGYDADDVTAEEGAYKRLPAACKKPAEVKPVILPTPPAAMSPNVAPKIAAPSVDSAKKASTTNGLKKTSKKL